MVSPRARLLALSYLLLCVGVTVLAAFHWPAPQILI